MRHQRSGAAGGLLDGRSLIALTLICAAALPVTLPMLRSFFTFDDLQNLAYYSEHGRSSVLSNLLVITPARRPLGSLFYLPSYLLFGLEPLPLYAAGFVLYHLNLLLLFSLILRLGAGRVAAVVATVVTGLNPFVADVLYNFGAVYELAAFGGLVAAIHAYHRFRAGDGGRRSYAAVWLFFAIGLNAKETAAALPAILLLYELTYGDLLRRRSRRELLRVFGFLLPFWLVAAAYTLAKTAGNAEFLERNPLYQLHPNVSTIVGNLAAYLSWLTTVEVPPEPLAVGGLVVGLGALALVLRSRHMAFGLGFLLLTLTPVIMLPRVWALFLYIPYAGAGLYLGGAAAEVLDRMLRAAKLDLRRRPPTAAAVGLAGVAVVALGALAVNEPALRHARFANFSSSTMPWKRFAHELWALHPTLGEGALLGFVAPPFPAGRDDDEYWCLHFLVWLRYGRDVGVYRIPEQREDFLAGAVRAPEMHLFEWRQSGLVELQLAEIDRFGR